MFPFCPPPTPWWKDLLLALPGVVTAGAALGGLGIARAGLDTWRRETIGKRKAELAEAVLADFYEARDIIDHAREPFGADGEGRTRERGEGETEQDSNTLDSYFRHVERLNNRSEFFAKLRARLYQYKALFGVSASRPFDQLLKIRVDIIHAARRLIFYHNSADHSDRLNQERVKWMETLG